MPERMAGAEKKGVHKQKKWPWKEVASERWWRRSWVCSGWRKDLESEERSQRSQRCVEMKAGRPQGGTQASDTPDW